MSVISCQEVIDNRGATQEFGRNVKTKRTWMATVDDPRTPVSDIANSVGIQWLDVHPEFPAVYCTQISCTNDGDPLHYRIEFTYDLILQEERAQLPWERQDKFTFGGSVTSGPAYIHYNQGFTTPKLIVNSAGDPLEGAEKECAEWRVQISGNRQTFNYAQAMAYVNAVNSDTWSGAPPGTVKCQGITGTKEVEQVGGQEVPFWSVSVDLAYRAEGWSLKVWDVGYNEIVGSQRKKILDKMKEPVSEPVALSNGVAKTPGQPPDMLTFKLYREQVFSGVFPALPS